MTGTTIHVSLADAAYDVMIEPGLLRRLGSIVAQIAGPTKALLAVDERITSGHGLVAQRSLHEAGFTTTTIQLAARELEKSLPTAQRLYEAMLGGGLDRSSPVVALGGGIIGDTVGFAAATYLRGVPLIQVPTTLLAMVDAAIGGKTAVNFTLPDGGLGKNIVGAYWQPKAVVIDPKMLGTLDPRDFRCGLAECVKYALVADASLLDFLADHAEAIQRLDMDTLARRGGLIERCVRIKAAIVEQDEREAGPRAVLNLGHTFAHAIEAQQELDVLHGEAVSIGLVAAADCALRTGRIDAAQQQRITKALQRFGLPLCLPRPVNADQLMRAMRYDKKALRGRMRLVLPVGLGAVEITDNVPADVVQSAWSHVGAVLVGSR
ncbi:MAG: 3-dehydroquinate synthase [Planctomycetes bacterium]|nr:3-dehydroquinate synthase [Planctomycetota bacterium]